MPKLLGKKKQALTTKLEIVKAFVRLIEKSNYDDIAIYQIIEEAHVSRRTFYRHFAGKEDLMDFCLDVFVMEYYQEREKFFNSTRPEEVFNITLSFVHDRRDFLRSLIESGYFSKFSDKFNQNSIVIYNTFGLPWNLSDELTEKEIDYVSKALIGAYLNVIKYWLVEDNPTPPETVARDIAMLFNSIPGYFANVDKKTAKNDPEENDKMD